MKRNKIFGACWLILSSLAINTSAFAQEPNQTQTDKANAVVVSQAKPSPNDTHALSAKININTANASEIKQALVGIGAKKAEAIIQYREKHGAFTAPEQLLEVQGIGKATLERNLDRFEL